MSLSQTPVASGGATSAGRDSLPTATRVVVVLIAIFAALGLLSILTQMARVTPVSPPIFGVIVRPAVGIAFSAVLGLVNLALALFVLRRYRWALDGLIAVQSFGAVNSCLYLVSPAQRAVISAVMAQTQAQMPAHAPGALDPHILQEIMSATMSSTITLTVVLNLVFLILLSVNRRRYRAICLPR
jgi:hypothetical protein